MTVIDKLRTALTERYRVEREIGAGGMATVYLARDLRHDRDVAIKVLHPDLAAALGAERFLAEIKTTAKLQHPHILPLLDSGEADGLLYYVMPFVSGESLRDRLERETQLAVDDAVRIAREALGALESAHKQGVVHRDIKPENILLHEDQALVADFGIALAVSAAGGPRMTQTGLSLGTPAYMAPEQAMGERVIDGRADIYALGAVLYEMLVGEAPFTGPSVQAIVARVMTESPRPVTGQRRSVPEHVNAAVLRSLEKLPADRFHSAAEFSSALVNPGFASRPATDATSATKPQPKSTVSRTSLIPWAIAAVAVLAAIFFAVKGRRTDENANPTYVSVDLPPDVTLPPETDVLGISDDGSTLAIGATMGGRPAIFLRRLDQDSSRLVQGSTGSIGSAAFSPDGKWLAFNSGRKVWRVAVKGGPPTAIAESNWAQMDWIGSTRIVYTKNYDSGLSLVSAEGSDTSTLTTPDRKKGELGHWWPQLLPDGDHILFTNYTTPAEKSKIEVISLKSKERKVVFDGAYFGRYVDGHLLFVRNNLVNSVPFDPGSLRTSGTPSPLPLSIEVNPPSGWAAYSIADNGTLAYRADAYQNIALTWSDETGNEETAIDSTGRYTTAAPSPDGKKIALVRDGDVWIYDRQRSIFSRLTNTDQIEGDLTWGPDSRMIYYVRDVPQYDIFRRAADGSSPEELIVTSGRDKHVSSISPDGRTLLYETDLTDNDLFSLSLSAAGKEPPAALVTGTGNQSYPKFSPDGAWFTYTSNESGRTEVFLSPYPVDRGPPRVQVSVGGGEGADWAPDGRAIYYYWSGKLYKVNVEARWGNIGRPEPLNRIQSFFGWTVAKDGRFLIARLGKGSERHSIKVIFNFTSTLKDTGSH
ncbi:MAG TPA: protein kinase [Gemmatimonadaceae bacterium]|nr:protein kinase [Gemmatimonadaceae bacterium]